ncbi:YfiR family protein [Steroidobacter sp. S1-65]|uniref:YfiR family protein n=1 Tax=Steroidobacter gossypii TaxID=2805490 RepID=A0ABS1WVF3_9GAMM|nr:YfiR family protein [Steroidobacter gossypii]MBM0104939.1 YfiR family protein [Steroidobacter gossypii]
MVATAALSFASAACAESVSEHRVKSAFLYNFTRFVEWPAERFRTPEEPIKVGVLGGAALRASLSALVADRRVGGRPILVVAVKAPAELATVHMLFIAKEEHDTFARMRPELEQLALLTVTDAQPCRTALAHICFVEQDEKLRFEIDVGAANRSQVRISSQLQKLAAAVHR